jgi:dolichol-phosphate mannosyltransferase
MRNLAKVELPARGSDFFLLDRVVIDAFARYRESNAEIVAILCSMGFRQDTFEYDKEPRRHGSSGWTFSKKLKLVIDSLTAFTYLPIRIMSVFGFVVTALSFLYGMVIIRAYMFGSAVQGWASLMVVILFLGGMQMMMLGVLGEYTWRALDESRARPRHLIEARSPDASDSPPPE